MGSTEFYDLPNDGDIYPVSGVNSLLEEFSTENSSLIVLGYRPGVLGKQWNVIKKSTNIARRTWQIYKVDKYDRLKEKSSLVGLMKNYKFII